MTKITVAKGDGIGPEIMDATLEIILAAGAKIEIKAFKQGPMSETEIDSTLALIKRFIDTDSATKTAQR